MNPYIEEYMNLSDDELEEIRSEEKSNPMMKLTILSVQTDIF